MHPPHLPPCLPLYNYLSYLYQNLSELLLPKMQKDSFTFIDGTVAPPCLPVTEEKKNVPEPERVFNLRAGNHLLGRLLQRLSLATSTRKVRDIIRAHSFVIHGERPLIPSARLLNGFQYSLPFVDCIDPDCTKHGFTIRVWDEWWSSQGWHPPMHPSTWPHTTIPFSPSEETSFGKPF
jgi:hypothetical protein